MGKGHIVCVPYPAQGHINPMMNLAKLLHHRGGFHITFVNTDYNHRRLLKSLGSDYQSRSFSDFRFESMPDGLPLSSEEDCTQDIPALCKSTSSTCPEPFRALLLRLNSTPDVPPVSAVISDGIMTFALDVAHDLSLPHVLLWTASACGMLCYSHYATLLHKGLFPLPDEACLSNGYLEKAINWMPGVDEIRMRDFPSFVRTTDPEDFMVPFFIKETRRACISTAVIHNTFTSLEKPSLESLSEMGQNIYSVGPLHLLAAQLNEEGKYKSLESSLWKEDSGCMRWLDSKPPSSVIYVNFGSITVMSAAHLREFAWGLANSMVNFLWIVRPDVVKGGEEGAVVPEGFTELTEGRGMVAAWCRQGRVLRHEAVGGFLTHGGWNSTVESLVGGVPMIFWPFFAEQQTNCYFGRREWGVGMELEKEVRREVVEKLVRELIEGDEGARLREKAREWKEKAAASISPGGSSFQSLDALIRDVLLIPKTATLVI